MTPQERKLLEALLGHTRETLDAVGGCDHGVGICCCGLVADIEAGEALLKSSEPSVSIEQVRQPLTAILGECDLADGVFGRSECLARLRGAALRLKEMCVEAERRSRAVTQTGDGRQSS